MVHLPLLATDLQRPLLFVFRSVGGPGRDVNGRRFHARRQSDRPERVFSPWIDLENELKANRIFLSSLESKRPLKDFDIVGFSLQYELSYTTILNMLHLGGIPIKTEDRYGSSSGNRYPLVIAGGPCAVNPVPMSPFIDAFLIGDGEEAIREILDVFYEWKTGGDGNKESLLKALSLIEGIYVPLFQRFKGHPSSLI